MKNLYSILFISILYCNFSFGQATKIDSLKNELLNITTDSSRVKILKDISWEYLNDRGNSALAKLYIDSIYSLSNKSNIEWGLALANYQYCVLERQKGNYNKALSFIDKYLKFWKNKGDNDAIANGLYQKAIIFDDKGSFNESLKIYYEIIKIYEQSSDTFGVATSLNAIGEVLKKTGKIQKALESYNEALGIFTKLNEKIEMANCTYNIGDSYLRLKDYTNALNYFEKALKYDTETNSKWGMAYDYESLGKVSNLQGNYKKALDYHTQALKIREVLQQKRELSMSYYEIGKTYFNLKDFNKAESFLINSLGISKKLGDKEKSKDNYSILSQLYRNKKNYKKAFEFSSKLIEVKDSLYNKTKSKQVEELQAKFENEKKENEIVALEKDAEIKDLRLKRQATFRNIVIGITLAAILLSFILFKRYQFKQKIKQEELEKQQLIANAELERERIIELQKIDKLKDEFLANTSHELRTPLTGIIGLTESLKDGIAGKLSSIAIENLDLIANSGKRLSHLVNDILDFSKLKNKDLVLNLNPVDLHSLVAIVLKLSKPLIATKNIELLNSIPVKFPMASADENRLQQIFYNLIGNAIKFTEKGKIEVIAKEINNKIEVTVSDTGIGIPKEKYDSVFNAFEQGDGSIVREQSGTGLGLTVTKQLVELHGGTIEFESEIGKGTVFTFELQISKSKPEEINSNYNFSKQLQSIQETTIDDTVESSIDNNSLNNKFKILIVDDEQINRKVLENHLSLAGYNYIEATNGKDALLFIKQGFNFDLVLLDIMMPGISGYEVCENIRKQYSSSQLPIILLTAKNRVSDLVTGFNAGANDYLTKPFSKSELLSRIKTHINLKNIHNATSKFIPAEFLKSIDKETITDVKLGDHVKKEITVLFTDIRDYTHFAESMTPEQNFKFVNAYVSRMGPLIQENRGFVNQYLGDGIMALFPYKPDHAIQAAIDMQKKIITYNKSRISEGYEPIKVGMGLHTGSLVMGIIGDVNRNDTAIIADTVNTSARMEGLTKHYGANIIISENSLHKVENKEQYNLRYLGKVQAKGKNDIVDIYECFDGDNNEQIELKKQSLKDFNTGFSHFSNKEFSKANDIFEEISIKNTNDQVAKYFASMSLIYRSKGVPNDWQAINTMYEK